MKMCLGWGDDNKCDVEITGAFGGRLRCISCIRKQAQWNSSQQAQLRLRARRDRPQPFGECIGWGDELEGDSCGVKFLRKSWTHLRCAGCRKKHDTWYHRTDAQKFTATSDHARAMAISMLIGPGGQVASKRSGW